MRRIWKIILSGAAVCLGIFLTGFLVYFFWQENLSEKRRQEESLKMESELRPLELEQNRLRQELEELEETYVEEARGTGNVVLLFTGLEEQIYTEIYPLMKEYGFTGVLAISGKQYPGGRGYLSEEQFEGLLEDGWTCCLKWEEGLGLWEWLKACEKVVREIGIERPGMVYFPPDTYSSRQSRFLSSRNFLVAVHHGEEERPLIVSGSEEKTWYLGSMGWSQDRASEMLSEAISQRGNLVFTVGSDREEEQYLEENFSVMLEWIRECCTNGELMTLSPLQFREYQIDLAGRRTGLEQAYEVKKAELELRLGELKQEMEKLAEKYLGDHK